MSETRPELSSRKRSALTRSRNRTSREKAEKWSVLWRCEHHPDRVRNYNLDCEGCIRDGFALRISTVRVGNHSALVVHLPESTDA